MIKEYIKIAIKSLLTRKLRSWLTMIGVVIGIFLIMSLLSLSQGIEKAVLQQLSMMGKDLIIVLPGEVTDITTAMGGGMELSEDDIEAIKKAEGVAVVVPMTYKGEAIRYEGEKKTVLITGAPWEETLEILKSDAGWDLSQGRWPISGKREICVGSLVPEEIFPGMKVGDKVTLKGKQFEVTGFLKSLGSKQDDSQFYLDLDVFREVTGERTGAKIVMAKIESGYTADEVVENIKEKLEESRKRMRGQGDLPSYTVLSSEKMSDIVGSIMAIVQLIVIGFASIAIVVGGIGIMNTMYTSVQERIREIGIMKAVGARNRSIVAIFLVESGIFGLFGGIGGVILGLGLAKIVEIYFQIHPVFLLEASITPQLILFGLTFSFLVGCIAGYLPAKSASKLNPVEALRYE
jgi:putative ABC transport system permease protein